jgi:hypothetical protein
MKRHNGRFNEKGSPIGYWEFWWSDGEIYKIVYYLR